MKYLKAFVRSLISTWIREESIPNSKKGRLHLYFASVLDNH